ncbi:LysR family transcriptional regulator [Paenibacillus sp. PR3]|uniref:LysR family transcriptional regulator n=1 Tax=Paenibacillus terricola TaxID=2763503 RepID=A0ABR8N606_9BACL|nr:LysR family transcriptional regulator [Paenibacillus terricola]
MAVSDLVTNMEWYRAFYWTAKAGSLSGAAEHLYITQPAVTHAIKQLESQLGGQLFFRTSKGVKLTAEGAMLYQHIEQAFNLIHAGERRLAERHALTEGEMRIGAGDTLCKHYLLPRMRQFHEQYPGVQFQVTNRTSRETVKLLKEGAIDFGIVNLPLEDPKLLIQESMIVQDCFVVSGTYRKWVAAGQPLSLDWEELSHYELLLLEKGSATRAYIDKAAAANDVALTPSMELGSLDLLSEFAQTGFGIACVVRNFAQDLLERGELVELAIAPPIPPRRIGIATLKDVPLSIAAKAFIALL